MVIRPHQAGSINQIQLETNRKGSISINRHPQTCPNLDYNSLNYAYIILLELILAVALILIMFSSLALTKMDCNRIANYFMLPILLGLAYFNVAHHNRATMSALRGSVRAEDSGTTSGPLNGIMKATTSADSVSLVSSLDSLVGSCELLMCNGLAGLTIIQLVANLLSRHLSKLVK